MKAPIEVRNAIAIPASAERVWDLLTDVGSWPKWWRACQWVRVESTDTAARPTSFRWKAHPVVLSSSVVASERPRLFAIVADSPGLHAERSFTIEPGAAGRSTIVISHETQVGPLPWFFRLVLGPRLESANQAMLTDLAQAVRGAS